MRFARPNVPFWIELMSGKFDKISWNNLAKGSKDLFTIYLAG